MASAISWFRENCQPASNFPGARTAPLSYPGKRPDFSYCFYEDGIAPITFDKNEPHLGPFALDEFLQSIGQATLQERFAVLAVGSNACPGRLQEKYGGSSRPQAIPLLRGIITGIDSVYCADLADYGAIPSTCIASEGTTLESMVNLLSLDQLEAMNATEDGYDLMALPMPFVTSGCSLRNVYAYVHHRILLQDGQPVRLSDYAAQSARFCAYNQEEILKCTRVSVARTLRSDFSDWHVQLRNDSALRNEFCLNLQEEWSQPANAYSPGTRVTIDQIMNIDWSGS